MLRCQRSASIAVGALDLMRLHRGWYLYVGSAFGPGGLGARLGRHLRTTKRRHWHIDTLLDHCPIRQIWYQCAGRELEHRWAQLLLSQHDVIVPLAGFGASDCLCRSHLIWARSLEKVQEARQALGPIASL
ncbi:MAG TPA: GIY-YIG nuclease family protein [Arenicellales bacterium]|nr:GIY-YIG nuclease family protein [Arenicellales bacterium]